MSLYNVVTVHPRLQKSVGARSSPHLSAASVGRSNMQGKKLTAARARARLVACCAQLLQGEHAEEKRLVVLESICGATAAGWASRRHRLALHLLHSCMPACEHCADYSMALSVSLYPRTFTRIKTPTILQERLRRAALRRWRRWPPHDCTACASGRASNTTALLRTKRGAKLGLDGLVGGQLVHRRKVLVPAVVKVDLRAGDVAPGRAREQRMPLRGNRNFSARRSASQAADKPAQQSEQQATMLHSTP